MCSEFTDRSSERSQGPRGTSPPSRPKCGCRLGQPRQRHATTQARRRAARPPRPPLPPQCSRQGTLGGIFGSPPSPLTVSRAGVFLRVPRTPLRPFRVAPGGLGAAATYRPLCGLPRGPEWVPCGSHDPVLCGPPMVRPKLAKSLSGHHLPGGGRNTPRGVVGCPRGAA